MSRPKDTQDAVDKSLTLLALEEYESPDELIDISRILIAQIQILELYATGYDRFAIAREVGVNEKTIRMWLNADHAPKLGHAIKLEKLYRRVKNHAKSTR